MSSWNKLIKLNSPCYGVILFELSLDGSNDKCVLVKTPQKKDGGGNNFGFPKGKAEKNKITKLRENIFQGASRELEEETGVTMDLITLADGVVFHELSNKGNVSISYLVGKFITSPTLHNFVCEDSDELSFVGLVSVEDGYKQLWKDRANLLIDAYDIITNSSTTFTEGTTLMANFSHNNKFDPTKMNKTAAQILKRDSRDMESSFDPIKISKAMSYILRHGAKDLGIPMDDNARILVSDLLSQPNFRNVTTEMIENIVDNNDKKRFEMETINGNLMIRAVQGHSKEFSDVIDETKLMDEITVPLEKCIHGTDKKAWKLIQSDGLRPQSRMHIHCAVSEPEDGQVISGMRMSTAVMIYIDMKKAMDDGIKFYLSKNKVILTNGKNGVLEPKYFKDVVIR